MVITTFYLGGPQATGCPPVLALLLHLNQQGSMIGPPAEAARPPCGWIHTSRLDRGFAPLPFGRLAFTLLFARHRSIAPASFLAAALD